jgi:hypothetical protein
MLPVSLGCSFWLSLRYSLTFIYLVGLFSPGIPVFSIGKTDRAATILLKCCWIYCIRHSDLMFFRLYVPNRTVKLSAKAFTRCLYWYCYCLILNDILNFKWSLCIMYQATSERYADMWDFFQSYCTCPIWPNSCLSLPVNIEIIYAIDIRLNMSYRQIHLLLDGIRIPVIHLKTIWYPSLII